MSRIDRHEGFLARAGGRTPLGEGKLSEAGGQRSVRSE